MGFVASFRSSGARADTGLKSIPIRDGSRLRVMPWGQPGVRGRLPNALRTSGCRARRRTRLALAPLELRSFEVCRMSSGSKSRGPRTRDSRRTPDLLARR
jgi:hypothetical protein